MFIGLCTTRRKPLRNQFLNWLKSNSIEHRSFYIVNMIWVKGNLDVAVTLASRSDVGRIDGNPEFAIFYHSRRYAPDPMRLRRPRRWNRG